MKQTEFNEVLAAAARLQKIVPDAVLVGGTASAQHAKHRVSFDDDHVLADLRNRFDQVLSDLEQTKGWITARVKAPVLILGSLDGVETGIRQLIRRRPLEVEIATVNRKRIKVPTLAEMLRIKAWLVLRRNATRDYLDVVALAARLGPEAAVVLAGLDDYYQDQIGAGGLRVATQVAKQLAEPAPYDLSEVDLKRYRGLVAKWREWHRVVADSRALALAIMESVS